MSEAKRSQAKPCRDRVGACPVNSHFDSKAPAKMNTNMLSPQQNFNCSTQKKEAPHTPSILMYNGHYYDNANKDPPPPPPLRISRRSRLTNENACLDVLPAHQIRGQILF